MKNNIKRVLLLVAVLTAAMMCLAFSASALEESGQCGENVYWNYNDSTGELVISGTGTMKNYSYFTQTPFYRANIRSIIIEEGVTSIGEWIFAKQSSLTSIIIPDSVTSIGYCAFEGCSGITDITLPNSITTIRSSTFSGCSSLSSITIPDNVTEIYSYAFGDCLSLSNISISDSVTLIGEDAFYNTAYYNNSSNWENQALYIGDYLIAFKDTVSSYDVKQGTKIIACSAFENCVNLNSVTIPNSVILIGGSAFEGCSNLTSISLPDSIDSIYEYTFAFCSSLKNITIPDSVTHIYEWAFLCCEGITDIIIPDSVIFLGNSAFVECCNLKSIHLSSALKCIEEQTFMGCRNLESVVFPDSIIKIGYNAFIDCSNIKTLYFGDSVNHIDENAFDLCNNISDIYYPKDEELWQQIIIKDDNAPLLNANIHFNHKHSNVLIEVVEESTHLKEGWAIYSCECGYSYNGVIPKLEGHTYTSEVTKEATHLVEGEITYTCACGDTYTEAIEKFAGHTYKEAVTEPTCTAKGYTTYTCVCGDTYVDNYTDKLDHEYAAEVAIEPTHLAEGVRMYSCECGSSYTETIEKLSEHNYVSIITTSPTHISEGVRSYICECGDSYTESVEKLPEHIYVTIIDKKPTCTDKGSIKYICECGKEYREQTDALGHQEVIDDAVPPTEKENGLTEGSHCSVCGEVLIAQKVIPSVLQYNGSYYIVNPISSDNINNAITLEHGENYYREYTSNYNSKCWYAKFTIKENSYASIGFTAKYYYDFSIRDENGFIVKDFGSKQKYNGYFPLEAGTYYVVLNNKSYSTNYVLLSYSLFENVYCEREPNDTFTTATPMMFERNYTVFGYDTYNYDHFSFNAKKGQKITVYVYGYEECDPYMTLYHSDRNTSEPISYYIKFDDNKNAYYYEFVSEYEGVYFIKTYSTKSGVYNIELHKKDCTNHNLKTTTTRSSLSKNGSVVSTCLICGYTKTTTIYTPKTFTLSATNYIYDGKAKTPTVTVKDSVGKTLKNGTDYTVSYFGGRTAIGKYTVTVNFKGNYSGSKQLSFTISTKAPSKVVAEQSTSAIKLTWTKCEGATGYRIYYKSGNTWKVAVSTISATSHTFSSLKAGTKYTYAVRPYVQTNSGVVWSDYTECATATKAVKPSKVTAKQTANTITLNWTKCSGATGYRIYYKSGSAWKVAVSSTAATSHTFKNLKAGAKYTFAIQPYIKTNSAVVWSDYTEFTTATKPATVTAKATSPSNGKISLSWNQVNGSEGYQVYYKTGNGSFKLYKTVSAGTKSLSFSNLKSGTQYTFAVRAGIRTSGGNIYGAYKTATVTVK